MSYFSLFWSLLTPPLGIPFLFAGILLNRQYWKTYIFCGAISIAVFAYVYTPSIETDLIRYFDYVEIISQKSFGELLNNNVHSIGGQEITVFAILSWIIGHMGDVHLLPFFSVFCIYYIGLYITCRVGQDYKISTKYLFLYIVFLLVASNFYAITNNIRNVFSFSIVSLACFRDTYLKNRNLLTWLLYILPIFIHPTAILFIVLRISLLFPMRMKLFWISLVVFINQIIGILYQLRGYLGGSIGSFISGVIIKSYNYFYDTSSAWGLTVQASGSEKIFRVVYISLGVIFCVSSYTLSKYGVEAISYNKKRNIATFVEFSLYAGLMTIACAPMLRPEYWRFAAIQIMISGPTYLLLMSHKNIPKIWKNFLSVIFLLMPVGATLWIRNVFLYVDAQEFLLQPLVTNPILLVLRGIVHFILNI